MCACFICELAGNHMCLRPSVTSNMHNSFSDFLKDAHAENIEIPDTINILDEFCNIRLIIANGTDPDCVCRKGGGGFRVGIPNIFGYL